MKTYKEFSNIIKVDESMSPKVLMDISKNINDIKKSVKSVVDDSDSQQKEKGYNTKLHNMQGQINKQLVSLLDMIEKFSEQVR